MRSPLATLWFSWQDESFSSVFWQFLGDEFNAKCTDILVYQVCFEM